MTERRDTDPQPEKPKNVAPDAVKDPNEKTEGKPGHGTSTGGTQRNGIGPVASGTSPGRQPVSMEA
jgi:hypothetical protein